MEGNATLNRARQIFKENFVGPDELKSIAEKLGIYYSNDLDFVSPEIPFSEEDMLSHKDSYVLILGIPYFKDRSLLNLVKMRSHFGWNPEDNEPCFYNQDWYLKESFANNCTIDNKWYLIRKSIVEESRGIEIGHDNIEIPNEALPYALLVTYTFYCIFLLQKIVLWEHDYIWCNDKDQKGDRIYVGRYKDRNGINKNGFSIHRQLSITNDYGVISYRYE